MTQSSAAPVPRAETITHARVLKVAGPIVLSNATVPLLGVVDTGVVGQLGTAAPIGAVGVGAIILTTLFWVFAFLRLGLVGLVGQAEGAGDRDEVSAWLTRGLLIAVASGLGLVALQGPIFRGALALSPASAEVERLTYLYMAIRIWTAPCVIASFALMGWLVARERTGRFFAVQIAMNGLNIVLSVAFVLGLGWGVPGVAVATAISELFGVALALWFCRDAFAGPAWRDWPRVLDRAKLVLFARLNLDIFIRSALLTATFASFTFFGARFGDVRLAANEVLIQFLHISAHAMDGFAFAAETLVARAVGRRSVAQVRQSAAVTSLWGAVICAVMAVAFALGGPALIDLMAKSEEVRATAREYLPWMVATPITGWAAWMLDGIFIGATRSQDMRNMMILSAAIYAVALVILLPTYGNHGLWAALNICLLARGLTLALRYPALERAVA